MRDRWDLRPLHLDQRFMNSASKPGPCFHYIPSARQYKHCPINRDDWVEKKGLYSTALWSFDYIAW